MRQFCKSVADGIRRLGGSRVSSGPGRRVRPSLEALEGRQLLSATGLISSVDAADIPVTYGIAGDHTVWKVDEHGRHDLGGGYAIEVSAGRDGNTAEVFELRSDYTVWVNEGNNSSGWQALGNPSRSMILEISATTDDTVYAFDGLNVYRNVGWAGWTNLGGVNANGHEGFDAITALNSTTVFAIHDDDQVVYQYGWTRYGPRWQALGTAGLWDGVSTNLWDISVTDSGLLYGLTGLVHGPAQLVRFDGYNNSWDALGSYQNAGFSAARTGDPGHPDPEGGTDGARPSSFSANDTAVYALGSDHTLEEYVPGMGWSDLGGYCTAVSMPAGMGSYTHPDSQGVWRPNMSNQAYVMGSDAVTPYVNYGDGFFYLAGFSPWARAQAPVGSALAGLFPSGGKSTHWPGLHGHHVRPVHHPRHVRHAR
jgi:hypothetical protein